MVPWAMFLRVGYRQEHMVPGTAEGEWLPQIIAGGDMEEESRM